MAVIKAVSSHAPIGTAIDYVEKREKTEKRLLSGIGVSPETAKEEMEATKEIYGKTGGRTYKHFVQSFAPGEDITPEKAHEIANEFAKNCSLFKGYEVLIATHKDKKHVHTHFIVNSVSYENGKKFQMSSKDLQKMKDLSDVICQSHGLSLCEKGMTFEGKVRKDITAWTKEKYRFLKDMSVGKTKKSYVYHTMEAVKNSMSIATSKEEFIRLLGEKGYSVDWQDKHKHLTFCDSEGNKVRDTNLNKTFNLGVGKNELGAIFIQNEALSEKIKLVKEKCKGIVARCRITEYTRLKKTADKEMERRTRFQEWMQERLDNRNQEINETNNTISVLEGELGKCLPIQIVKKHELELLIEQNKAYLEGVEKRKEQLLKKNNFQSEDEFKCYKDETEELADISDSFAEFIKTHQQEFDTIYWQIRDIQEVSEINLSDKDIDDLKRQLSEEFGKEVTTDNIKEAMIQFEKYDNGDKSLLRKLKKEDRESQGKNSRDKDLVSENVIEKKSKRHDIDIG